MHESNAAYGTSSAKFAPQITAMAVDFGCKTILDYGCGKGLLKKAMKASVIEYDPAIAGKNSAPDPADMVVCSDVMEHIEPLCLEDVLDDLVRVTKKWLFMTIATRPAVKFLADGRNAHLIVETLEWWRKKIEARFKIIELRGDEGEMILFACRRVPC